MAVRPGSYTLQPGLTQIDRKAFPQDCAYGGDFLGAFPHPQPGSQSSLGYSCRPSTMEYGTAPYMAGKGAPGHLIDLDDQLRPQSTKRFGKVLIEPFARNFFPLQDTHCLGPQRTMPVDPASTRAQVQNGMFQKRYCGAPERSRV
jgi:hypothetical protein